MTRLEELKAMNELLLEDQPEYREEAKSFGNDEYSQRRLMRSLMNVRPPKAIPENLLKLQDQILQEEKTEKGIVKALELPRTKTDSRIAIWQGDITRLEIDGIVNAANSQMLGCFVPCHGCIDNAIHSASGLQLRQACWDLMREQGHEEETGTAKITPGFNLPARYVLHTVGPIVEGRVTKRDEELLASCYRSCLELAQARGLESLAFCCISTGVFHFPVDRAAEIACDTVKKFLIQNTSMELVVFNVFKDTDLQIYQRLLGEA